MSKKPTIYIYGLCNVYYESFYIKGLKEYFGIKNVYFNISKFPKFGIYDAMAVIIKFENYEIKLCVDSNDRNEIIQNQLDWCDIYGKVNYNLDVVTKTNSPKIKAIGPSFGIKIWSFPKTYFLGFTNFLRFYKNIPLKKYFLSNYKAQYERLPLRDYLNGKSHTKHHKKYIFFIGSIWKQEQKTNNLRATFITACKKNELINFEGGFAPRSDGNNLEFDNLVLDKPYSLKDYLKKTKESMIVFNTPAVEDCHGWKLAEFLAMGKAIISTSFHNKMPVDLVNNEDIIFLKNNTEAEIDEKLLFVLENNQFKSKLEENSKIYFQKYLMPKKVIENLLG